MTQIFTADGTVVPVTVVQAGPCLVVQKKTADKEGYDALQIGLVGSRPDRRANAAAKGHFEKAGVAPMRTLMEVRADKGDDLKPGDKVLCDTFAEQDHVDVIGTSKGKGFMGVVARHGFRGGAATHGSMFHRAPGLDRPVGLSLARLPGHALLGAAGRAAVDLQEPRRRSGRRREEPALHLRRRSRRPQRDREDRALELRQEESLEGFAWPRFRSGTGRRNRWARSLCPPTSSRTRTAATSSGRSSRPTSRVSAPERTRPRSAPKSPARARSPSSRRGPAGRGRAAGVRRSTAMAAPCTAPCRAPTPRPFRSARRRTP